MGMRTTCPLTNSFAIMDFADIQFFKKY